MEELYYYCEHFTGKYSFRCNNTCNFFVHVDNNIQLFDGFEDNFLEWQYCPCDRFSVIGTSTDYMYLFTINIWYKELVNLVYFENKFRIVSSISTAAAVRTTQSRHLI